jgi:adenylate kinase
VRDGASRFATLAADGVPRRSMTVVVLLGAPGAGKGTQAPVLAEHLGVPILASGELLRTAVSNGTPLGREADRYMSRGQLVPDTTIVRVFLDRLEHADATRGAILDGFPRTRVQAAALDEALGEAGRRVDHAIYIDVPAEELVQRMANRRICTANGHVYNLASNRPIVDMTCDLDGSPIVQRPDDEEATVRARMTEQIPPLLDVVDHYRTAGVLQTVDGRASIDDVSHDVVAAADDAPTAATGASEEPV